MSLCRNDLCAIMSQVIRCAFCSGERIAEVPRRTLPNGAERHMGLLPRQS